MSDDILVAKKTATFDYNGERIVVHAGITRVRAGHPMLEGREDLFEPIDVHYDVEDATARPGAKRSGGSTGGRTRRKKTDEGSEGSSGGAG
ncbi:hypothetical protein [Thermomonospora amylolytica]|uniref:hypothetical protein n=1 Tax=Thermomonospora amylolytica TaxID=1411117 RepID=UPI000E6BFDA1|nr:hypothetical protein [Thermomonospora amylolytica]